RMVQDFSDDQSRHAKLRHFRRSCAPQIMPAKFHLRIGTNPANELLNFSHAQTAVPGPRKYPRRVTAWFLSAFEWLLRFHVSCRFQVLQYPNCRRRERYDVYMAVLGELAWNRP